MDGGLHAAVARGGVPVLRLLRAIISCTMAKAMRHRPRPTLALARQLQSRDEMEREARGWADRSSGSPRC